MKPSEKLIQKILEEEPTRPTPRWVFLLKNKIFLFVFVVALILGGLAFSVILLALRQTDFDLISHMKHSRTEMFLGLLPFVWIVLTIVFLVISMYAVMFSKKGYKLTLAKLFLDSAVISVLLGTLFFIAGGSEKLEGTFAANVEIYESLQEKKVKLWSNPEEGYLSGIIQDVKPDKIGLKDFSGASWQVDYGEAFVANAVLLEKGEKIKLIGEIKQPGVFTASEIRPWGGRGEMSRGGHGNQH